MDGDEVVDGIQIARLDGLVQGVSFGVERRRIVVVRPRLVGGNGEQGGGEDGRSEQRECADGNRRETAEYGNDENDGSPVVVVVFRRPAKAGRYIDHCRSELPTYSPGRAITPRRCQVLYSAGHPTSG